MNKKQAKNKEKTKIIVTVTAAVTVAIMLFAVILVVLSIANNDNDNRENNGSNSDNYKEIEISVPDLADLTITGKVRDVYFNPYLGIDIYFESRGIPQKAAVSQEDGSFIFYLKNTNNNPYNNRIKDFISVDGNNYNYNVVNVLSLHGNNKEIDIVCAPKESEINVYNLLSFGNKVSFHESGLTLPKGYISRESIVTKTIGGETVLRGVEFYVGEHLVGVGNHYGFGLENIYPGTVITLKKEGFTFVTLSAGGTRPLTVPATNTTPEYPDSFIVPNRVNPFPYEIRAVIKEGLSINDLDL